MVFIGERIDFNLVNLCKHIHYAFNHNNYTFSISNLSVIGVKFDAISGYLVSIRVAPVLNIS